jgi:hypothetical protein
MAIYQVSPDRLEKIEETTFDAAGLFERSDLQRLLRDQIEIISPDTLIIAEEFGEWDDSKRRIDLLGLDKSGNLVVFELKRTADGGHMELQAIRYAAMVSRMTFDKAAELYQNLKSLDSVEKAKDAILSFLEWEKLDEDDFAQDVRIILVSADFSKEITTSVMWLNERDLDIRCVRLKPYKDNGRTLIDVQQIIPLPEAVDYMIQVREKEGKERVARRGQSDLAVRLQRFWAELLQRANQRTELHASISPGRETFLAAGAGVSGLRLVYAFGHKVDRVELYIDKGDKEANKKVFDELFAQKQAIEDSYGEPFVWQRLDTKRGCRIYAEVDAGLLEDENEWPGIQTAMIDTMIRFEKVLRPHIDALGRR